MSREAPWIALAVDWADSEMFVDATDGERLAWVCLLCEAKRSGRGGKLAFRKSALMRTYSLSERSVDGMLERAQKCGALTMAEGIISLCNWKAYQQRVWDSNRRHYWSSAETPENPATNTNTNTNTNTKNTERRAANAAVRVPPSAGGGRKPDPIWDTVMELWPSDAMPSSERGRRNKVVADLKAVSATPDEIRIRNRVMRKQYKGDPAKCTPMALVSRWSEFAGPPRKGPPPALPLEYQTTPGSTLTVEEKRALRQQAESELRV